MRYLIIILSLFIITCGGGGGDAVSGPDFEDPITTGYIRANLSISDNFGIFDINKYEFRVKQNGEYIGQTHTGNLSLKNSYDGKQDTVHTIVVPSDFIGTYGEQYIFDLKLYNHDDYLTYNIETVNTITVNANQVTDAYLNPPLNFDWLILYPMLHADIYNSFTSDFLPFIDDPNNPTLYIENGKLIVPPKEDNNYLHWWFYDLEKTQLGDLYVSFDLSRDLTGSNKGQFGMFFGYKDYWTNKNMYQFIMIDFEKDKIFTTEYDTTDDEWGYWSDLSDPFSTAGVMNVDIHYDNYNDNTRDGYDVFINGQKVTTLGLKVDRNITRIGIVKSGSHKSIIDNFMIYY